MLGFLFAILMACRRAQKEGIDPNHVLDLGIVCVIFGILGARLFFVIQFWYKFQGAGRFFNVFDGNISGMGIILGLLAGAVIFHGRRYVRLFKILHNLKPYTIVIGVVFVIVFALFAGRMIWLAQNSDSKIDTATGRIVSEDEKTTTPGMPMVKETVSASDYYPLDIFKIWSGGLVYYGGLIGAAGFAWIFLVLRTRSTGEFKIWHLADAIAPFLALGLAFGRVGCFLNGCCWGKVAPECYCSMSFPGPGKGYDGVPSHAWRQHTAGYVASTSPGEVIRTGCHTKFESKGAIPVLHPESLYLPETAHKLSKAEVEYQKAKSRRNESSDYSLSRKLEPAKNGYDPWFKPLDERKDANWSYRILPTQPLSFLCAIWLWIFLMGFFKRRRHNGETLLLFGALYSVIRFTVEFCRGDVPRGYLFGLTISQTVSVFSFLACGIAFAYLFFLSRVPRAKLAPLPFIMGDKQEEEEPSKKKKKPKKKKKKKAGED
jgi:prolipoprotein diacylglyceryltransferase